MPVRPIVSYPDPRLRQVAAPVTRFDDDLAALARDLLDTMHAAPGVGITGPHVGDMRRVVVLQLTPGEPAATYVNPVVAWASDDTIRHVEGSVSMPGATAEVTRPGRIRVAFQDLAGADHAEEAEGFRAVCLQHEIDQLDGVFWIDRLSRLKRDMVVKRYEKTRKTGPT